MDFDLILLRALLAFSTLFALLFLFQRARYKRRKRQGKKHLGFYPSAVMLGNALQTLQIFTQPHVEYILEEKLDEDAEDDDDGDPDDPFAQLNRQLKQIRNGEPVDTLRVPISKRN